MATGDIWSIEKGGNAKDAIEDLRSEEDPFPQYLLPGEGGEGGTPLPVKSYTFDPATSGQTVFTIPNNLTVNDVVAVDHDGVTLWKSRGYYSVVGRVITMTFGSAANAIVTAVYQ